MRPSIPLSAAALALGLIACDAPAPSGTPAPSPSGSGLSAPVPSNTAATRPVTSSLPVDPPPAAAVAKLAQGSNAFGFDLLQRLRNRPGNLVVSPASITTALAMTWGGARGETAAQMKKVLHLEGSPQEVMTTSGKLAASLADPTRPLTFRIANQLFGEKTFSFEQPFLDQTRAAYGAPIELLDFKTSAEPARQRVNAWVLDKTEKRIKDLVPAGAIDGDTRLVLVNAIYFLGDWEEPFEKNQTRPAAFSTSKEAKKDVPTMNRTDSYRFLRKSGMSALEIPYKGGAMSMLVVVPDEIDGLAALEKSLDANKLGELVKAMKPERVWAQIPKFEIDPAESLSLGNDLKAMGMELAFERGKADFTAIANPPNPEDRLYIAKVFHKGFIRVDEKGTEAAAATAVPMAKAGGAPQPPVEFKADHPFAWFIRDNASGLVLFMGHVSDPSQK